MQALERAEGVSSHVVGSWMSLPGSQTCVSRACKGAQEGNKPGVGRVGGSVTGDGVDYTQTQFERHDEVARDADDVTSFPWGALAVLCLALCMAF